VVVKETLRGTEPEPLVSSSNPFLLMAEKKEGEADEESEDAVDSVSLFLFIYFCILIIIWLCIESSTCFFLRLNV